MKTFLGVLAVVVVTVAMAGSWGSGSQAMAMDCWESCLHFAKYGTGVSCGTGWGVVNPGGQYDSCTDYFAVASDACHDYCGAM